MSYYCFSHGAYFNMYNALCPACLYERQVMEMQFMSLAIAQRQMREYYSQVNSYCDEDSIRQCHEASLDRAGKMSRSDGDALKRQTKSLLMSAAKQAAPHVLHWATNHLNHW